MAEAEEACDIRCWNVEGEGGGRKGRGREEERFGHALGVHWSLCRRRGNAKRMTVVLSHSHGLLDPDECVSIHPLVGKYPSLAFVVCFHVKPLTFKLTSPCSTQPNTGQK